MIEIGKKLIFTTFSLLILTGCNSLENKEITPNRESSKTLTSDNERFDSGEDTEVDFRYSSNIKIIKDTSTGCQYVLINPDIPHAVMSPYYNEKGEVNGCGEIYKIESENNMNL